MSDQRGERNFHEDGAATVVCIVGGAGDEHRIAGECDAGIMPEGTGVQAGIKAIGQGIDTGKAGIAGGAQEERAAIMKKVSVRERIFSACEITPLSLGEWDNYSTGKIPRRRGKILYKECS